MPRKYEMSWDKHQSRWTKMYKGVRHVVSCYSLGAPPTKEGSAERANEWWRAKKAELDGYSARPAPGSPQAVQALLEAWAGQSLTSEAEAAAALLDFEEHFTENSMPREVQEALLGSERVAQLEVGVDALRNAPEAPPEKTIGRLVNTWVETEAQRVRAGKLGLARANMNRVCLHHFRNWLGANSPVEAVTEGKWLEWYTFLSGQISKGVWDVSHVDRIFAVARRFVRFLWDMRLVELPRNLDSKRLAFTVSPKEIEVFSTEELKALWAVVSGQTKLHVLLMLNCGFIGKDISDLRQDDVDWTQGVISRKRSKTARHEDVPVVRYNLWPQTFELLKKHRSKDAEVVLLTTGGKRWIETKQTDTFHHSDKVASAMKYWLKRAGVKRAPKALRATAASKLGEHSQYKFYAQYFLGQSPRTVADKHYVKPADKEFFEALAWLEGALALKW